MNLIHSFKKTFNPRKLRNAWLGFCLKGNNVECVCCGKSFVTFLPAGIQKRPNAMCPSCGSLERHRILWMYLKQKTNLFKDTLKVLHPAPEKLFYTKFRSMPNIDYTSIDLHPELYDYGSKTIKMDLTALTFEDNKFDVIICNHVLEHIPADTKAMREMFRVLKKGGWALINVPVDSSRETTFEDITINDPKKQLELFGQPDHVRVYGKDYIDRLKKAGFDVEVFDFTDHLSHNDMFCYGMVKGREIYRCTKK